MFVECHATKPASKGVLLHHVVDHPEIVRAVVAASGNEQLLRLDRGDDLAFGIHEAGRMSGFGKRLPLAVIEPDLAPLQRSGQGFFGFAKNAIGAFDDLPADIAAVAHLHAVDGAGLRDKGVEAADTEQPGHKLIGGGAVIGVAQKDFANRVARPVLLGIVNPAQADQVLGELRLAGVPRMRLLGSDRHEPFGHQPAQNLDRRDRLEAFRPAFMGGNGKDGRGCTAKLVLGQRAAGVEAGSLGVDGHGFLSFFPRSGPLPTGQEPRSCRLGRRQ